MSDHAFWVTLHTVENNHLKKKSYSIYPVKRWNVTFYKIKLLDLVFFFGGGLNLETVQFPRMIHPWLMCLYFASDSSYFSIINNISEMLIKSANISESFLHDQELNSTQQLTI